MYQTSGALGSLVCTSLRIAPPQLMHVFSISGPIPIADRVFRKLSPVALAAPRRGRGWIDLACSCGAAACLCFLHSSLSTCRCEFLRMRAHTRLPCRLYSESFVHLRRYRSMTRHKASKSALRTRRLGESKCTSCICTISPVKFNSLHHES